MSEMGRWPSNVVNNAHTAHHHFVPQIFPFLFRVPSIKEKCEKKNFMIPISFIILS
jgi:hypothetical protein